MRKLNPSRATEAARIVLIVVGSIIILSGAPRTDEPGRARRAIKLASEAWLTASASSSLSPPPQPRFPQSLDGLVAPAAAAAAAAESLRLYETQHECDRAPRDPALPVEPWRANIFVPPQPWAPFTAARSFEWLHASGALPGRAQVTELHRFTAERRAIVSSFAPALEVPNVEHLHMMSPALVWAGGRFLAFLRVSNYPDELYDNFLWVEEFSDALQPLPGSGRIVGLPTHSANLMAPGPEDPRVIIFRGSVLVLFNLQFRNNDRRQVLYDHDKHTLVVLNVEGLAFQRAEKNWMPFVHADALHFIYQLEPLVVIRCELTGACVCIVPDCLREERGPYDTRKALARGGTSLNRVADNLFFGLIHSTFGDHAIRGHMLLFSTAPMGVVAISSTLPVPEALASCYATTVPWDVQFPSSVTILGESALAASNFLVGVHVRDAMASLLFVDMFEPLGVAVGKIHEAKCLAKVDGVSGGGNLTCSRWEVLGDGRVDATLAKGLAR